MGYKYKTTPYDHQREVLNHSWRKRAFALLMEMGTGKTKVIIDNVAALWEEGLCSKLLILAPKSVTYVWIDELGLHMPDRIPYIANVWEAGMGKGQTAELELLQKTTPGYPCLRIAIMGTEGIWCDNAYDWAERFIDNTTFMTVDESTLLKNPKAKRTKAACALGRPAAYRRILTGQPVPQGPLDLYAQCEFLEQGALGYGSYTAFKSVYAITKLVDLGGRKKFEQIIGYRNLDDLTDRLLGFAFIVKKDRCLDLPPKIYNRINVPLSAEQQRAYVSMREDAVTELQDGSLCIAGEIITRMLRLHQITCGYLPDENGKLHPIKNDRMRVLMDEVLPNVTGNAVIWTHFVHSILMIATEMRERYGHEAVATFYGNTPSKDRQQIVRNFQNKKHPLRWIIANKTAAYGLTLTAATNMIYYTNQWSLDVRQQSEDRAHRSGLRHAVTYTDLVSPGTIDVAILRALRAKRDIARQVLSTASGALETLTSGPG